LMFSLYLFIYLNDKKYIITYYPLAVVIRAKKWGRGSALNLKM